MHEPLPHSRRRIRMIAAARHGALRRHVPAALLALALAMGADLSGARAQHAALRSFGEAEGLESDAVSVIAEAPSGFLVVCTEGGVFFFDGRSFSHIGPDQGIPTLMDARSIAIAPDGRIAMADDRRILVSSRTTSSLLSTLQFADATPRAAPAPAPAPASASGTIDRLTWWRGGLIVEQEGRLRPALPLAPMPTPALWDMQTASAMVVDGDRLILGTRDGRICEASTTGLTCQAVASANGSSPDDWTALALGRNGTIYARSSSHFAYRAPHAHDFVVEPLPDDRSHDGYRNRATLAVLPDGTVVTEAQDHVMARRGGVWKIVSQPAGYGDAIPEGLIAGRDGELWFGLSGAGIVEAPAFGNIDSYGTSDGLDLRAIWQIGPGPRDTLLMGTSRGLLVVPDHGDKPPGLLAGGTIAMLQTGGDGTVWATRGVTQLLRYASLDAPPLPVPTPPIRQIIADGEDGLWILSNSGLYRASSHDAPGVPASPDPVFRTELHTGLMDRRGRLWLASMNELLIRHPDGHAETLLAHWPDPDFRPNSMTEAGPDTVLIAGSGALLSVTRHGPGRVTCTRVMGPGILTRDIYSLATAANGTIWAATDHGLAAFDGRQWIDITTNDGLIWNDTDQAALYPAPDGSVWVGTSVGFSHIHDPAWMFRSRPLHVVVSDVHVGERAYDGHRQPYSRAPLMIRFGITNLPRAAAVHFRYRLSGVDQTWNETGGTFVRYPSLPPGRHVFDVVAFDPMTGALSPPATIALDMALPWWDWWSVEAAYGLAAILGVLGFQRLRDRYLKRQRQILLQTVALRTRELEAAKAALEHEARTDGMTGLLNRRAIQQLLSDILSGPRFANVRGHHPAANVDQTSPYMVALLDIDHFKRINDVHGHLVGDQVLREMGERVRLCLEPQEYCGRYGGEEFLYVAISDARPGIERIAALIACLTHAPFAEPLGIPVTLSVGFATTTASDSWQSVIGRADKALYRAKAQGRDRIVIAA